MATTGLVERATGAVTAAVTLPIKVVGKVATEPILTGSVLLALTRAPEKYRGPLLRYLHSKGVSTAQIALLIKSLKYLLAIGVLRKLNAALNLLAVNRWRLSKPGTPFDFDATSKPELIVVTGGCSGFGYEMVKEFSKHARVIILDVSPVPAELEKIPGVHYYQLDVTDFAAIESTAEQIRKEHGDPTVLINNAGVASGTKIIDSDAQKTDRIFKVNLASHFILIKQFLPGMLKAKKGHIVTVASMASYYPSPGLVDYCCTKVGALYLHEGLRSELRDYYENGDCIQLTSVHPSWHSTGIIKDYEDKLRKFGVQIDPASNVSNAIVEQVLAGRSGQIYMPRSEVGNTGVRNYPLWVQDFAAYVRRKRAKFEF
ncbi:short chain dehydrogenase/reductase [Exophiala viscosa]|uniref:Short chain dehydrogenase/reductase n=1 Tax=Exophiala viscosa TaxID=2486360 RepID=A0AAN6DPD8_9EURO|nr:short chain dehydrogenase/reductase [Exophiala viscosa]KAI1625224.1 short chain dehydrogenase/reductase [Exophiala viscosa]